MMTVSLQSLSGESSEIEHVTPTNLSYDVLIIEILMSCSAVISLIPIFQPLALDITSVSATTLTVNVGVAGDPKGFDGDSQRYYDAANLILDNKD